MTQSSSSYLLEVVTQPHMDTMTILSGRSLNGAITVPGDKSISHRVLILGALARGISRATGFLPSDDCISTMHCLMALGVRIDRPNETTAHVHGVGLRGFIEPDDVLGCGNSGTTMRLLSGILAAQDFYAVLTGDASLRRRPMARIAEPLRRMGATVMGRHGGAYPPLTIHGGRLHAMEYAMPVASAQVKSCILLAGLYADGASQVTEPFPSRDHTERMLQVQGVRVLTSAHVQSATVTSPSGAVTITVDPPREPLLPLDVDIPGDISSAAFFLVAASIVPRSHLVIRGVGINSTRAGILDVLAAMGAQVGQENSRLAGGEPVADLVAQSAALRGTEICGALVPRLIDELPVIAVAATQAHGTTTVHDASELRVKESDRITALVTELRKLGAQIEELPDGFEVHGPSPLHGSVVDAHGDHRLAMSLAVAGLVAHGETTILGTDSIPVSFPGFQGTLATCMGENR